MLGQGLLHYGSLKQAPSLTSVQHLSPAVAQARPSGEAFPVASSESGGKAELAQYYLVRQGHRGGEVHPNYAGTPSKVCIPRSMWPQEQCWKESFLPNGFAAASTSTSSKLEPSGWLCVGAPAHGRLEYSVLAHCRLEGYSRCLRERSHVIAQP